MTTPWPPNRWPTESEWVDWFTSLDRVDQLAAAGRVIATAQRDWERASAAHLARPAATKETP